MGTILLSVDAELGWGWHDLSPRPTDRIAAGRAGWKRLVELFEEFSIPATWAVVGHLLLDSCDGRHDDHPLGPEWFEAERTDWETRPDLRFGRGLVDELRQSDVDHEIGGHTFSHVRMGSSRTTTAVARAELAEFDAVASEYGIVPRSFVYPRNDVGHRDLLAEFGYEAYRGRPARRPAGTRTSPVAKVANTFVPGMHPPLVEPRVDEYGLVNIPPSLYLFGFEGVARTVISSLYTDPIVVQARRGIDAASRSAGVFHLWLHPNNLVAERDVRRVRAILSYIAERRRAGDVDVATMGQIAERVGGDRGSDSLRTDDGPVIVPDAEE